MFGGSHIGGAAATGGGLFGAAPIAPLAAGGINHHAQLVQFYQQVAPAKVAGVAQTLAKYQGKEMQMWAGLFKKYNIPQAQHQIILGTAQQGAAAGGFGAATNSMGATGGFGASSGFGTPAATGFGGISSPQQAGGFGQQAPLAGFGQSSGLSGGFGTSGSTWGAPAAAGAAKTDDTAAPVAAAGGGLFGAAAAGGGLGGFGAAAPAAGGMFGGAAAAPAAGGMFGGAPVAAATGGGLLGAAPAAAEGGVGAAPAAVLPDVESMGVVTDRGWRLYWLGKVALCWGCDHEDTDSLYPIDYTHQLALRLQQIAELYSLQLVPASDIGSELPALLSSHSQLALTGFAGPATNTATQGLCGSNMKWPAASSSTGQHHYTVQRVYESLIKASQFATLLHRLQAHDPSLTVVQCHSGSTPEQIMHEPGGVAAGGGMFGGAQTCPRFVEGIDLGNLRAEMLADVSLE